jgi:hypothetical protein
MASSRDPRQAEIEALAAKADALFNQAERLKATHRSDRAVRAHLAKVKRTMLAIEQGRQP